VDCLLKVIFIYFYCLRNTLVNSYSLVLFLGALAALVNFRGTWCNNVSLNWLANSLSIALGKDDASLAVPRITISVLVVPWLHILLDHLKIHDWNLWLPSTIILHHKWFLRQKKLLINIHGHSIQSLYYIKIFAIRVLLRSLFLNNLKIFTGERANLCYLLAL
jgi:hypothetical protein